MPAVITISTLEKTYAMGATRVRALGGIALDIHHADRGHRPEDNPRMPFPLAAYGASIGENPLWMQAD